MVEGTRLESVRTGNRTVGSNPTSSAFARRSRASTSYGGRSPPSSRMSAKERFAMDYVVYILKCADGKPYTGCTKDLEERFARHQNGYVSATKDRRPVELITQIAFNDKYKAYEFEKYLKSGSGRAFVKKHFL